MLPESDAYASILQLNSVSTHHHHARPPAALPVAGRGLANNVGFVYERHGRLHEDFSVTGLLKRPRVLGPVAIRADRWPDMTIDPELLKRDPVIDHGASWVLALLCAANGGEVVSTDAYHARRLRRDAHDIDELRPEGRAWLVTHGQRMIPEHAIGQNEAHALWKAWSGAR